MTKYAAQTTVSSEKSRVEIERILTRYGATQFVYGWNGQQAMIAFHFQGRYVRFNVTIPEAGALRTTKGYKPRDVNKTYGQVIRQRWRALALAIKAKLELVESGITTFEQEFLAHVVLPNKQTIGEWIAPQLEHIYTTQNLTALLPGMQDSPDGCQK